MNFFFCESCGFVPTKTKRSAFHTEEEKRVGPTVEKKKSAMTCPLWPRGERSDASSNTRNALVSMGSFGCEACSSGVVVGYNTEESCNFS